jgi:hypothetical protein
MTPALLWSAPENLPPRGSVCGGPRREKKKERKKERKKKKKGEGKGRIE